MAAKRPPLPVAVYSHADQWVRLPVWSFNSNPLTMTLTRTVFELDWTDHSTVYTPVPVARAKYSRRTRALTSVSDEKHARFSFVVCRNDRARRTNVKLDPLCPRLLAYLMKSTADWDSDRLPACVCVFRGNNVSRYLLPLRTVVQWLRGTPCAKMCAKFFFSFMNLIVWHNGKVRVDFL